MATGGGTNRLRHAIASFFSTYTLYYIGRVKGMPPAGVGGGGLSAPERGSVRGRFDPVGEGAFGPGGVLSRGFVCRSPGQTPWTKRHRIKSPPDKTPPHGRSYPVIMSTVMGEYARFHGLTKSLTCVNCLVIRVLLNWNSINKQRKQYK